jgi:hypothetical protein
VADQPLDVLLLGTLELVEPDPCRDLADIRPVTRAAQDVRRRDRVDQRNLPLVG